MFFFIVDFEVPGVFIIIINEDKWNKEMDVARQAPEMAKQIVDLDIYFGIKFSHYSIFNVLQVTFVL